MPEAIVSAWLLIVVGAIRVVPQLAAAGRWGAEPTIAAGCLALGVAVLVGELGRHRHRGRPRRARRAVSP